MSQFVTLVPTASSEDRQIEELDFAPPAWLDNVATVLSCVPVVLVILYWMKKLKCDQVISYSVVTLAILCVLIAGTFYYAVRTATA